MFPSVSQQQTQVVNLIGDRGIGVIEEENPFSLQKGGSSPAMVSGAFSKHFLSVQR
jgi:hypothetical protein